MISPRSSSAWARVKLLKMDIEGAELVTLNHLLDTKAAENVDTAFVELHDRKNPAMTQASGSPRRG